MNRLAIFRRTEHTCVDLALLCGFLVGAIYACLVAGWALPAVFLSGAAYFALVRTALLTARLCVMSVALRQQGY